MGQIALWKVGIYWTKYEWVCLVDTCMSELSVWTPITSTRRRNFFQPTPCLTSQEMSDIDLMAASLEMSVLSFVYKVQTIAITSQTFQGKMNPMPITYPFTEKKGRSRHPMVSVPAFEINLSGLNITQRGWLQQDEQFYFAQFVHSFLQMDWEEEKETNADSTDTY